MPKRSNKRMDINLLAKSIVDQATGQTFKKTPDEANEGSIYVATGRLGGLKGGKSRAERLTPQERSEIAKKAANARWSKRSQE